MMYHPSGKGNNKHEAVVAYHKKTKVYTFGRAPDGA